MIIDAKNLIAGRLGTFAAKQALMGEEISIVNAELAVITGNKKFVINKYRILTSKGNPQHGPFIPRSSDRLLKRIIRGMLPHKQEKGKSALKRIKCFIGVPNAFRGKELITIDKANVLKMQNLKYISIKELCNDLKQR